MTITICLYDCHNIYRGQLANITDVVLNGF